MSDGRWREDAACLGAPGDLFFPNPTHHRQRELAITRFCRRCPVKTECHDYAVQTTQRFGIWGGEDFDWRHNHDQPAAA